MRQLWRGLSQRIQDKKGQKLEIWVRNNYVNGCTEWAGPGISQSRNINVSYTISHRHNNNNYYAASAYLSVALNRKIIIRLQEYIASWNVWLFDFSPNKIRYQKNGNIKFASKARWKGRQKFHSKQGVIILAKSTSHEGRREKRIYYNNINRSAERQRLGKNYLEGIEQWATKWQNKIDKLVPVCRIDKWKLDDLDSENDEPMQYDKGQEYEEEDKKSEEEVLEGPYQDIRRLDLLHEQKFWLAMIEIIKIMDSIQTIYPNGRVLTKTIASCAEAFKQEIQPPMTVRGSQISTNV